MSVFCIQKMYISCFTTKPLQSCVLLALSYFSVFCICNVKLKYNFDIYLFDNVFSFSKGHSSLISYNADLGRLIIFVIVN